MCRLSGYFTTSNTENGLNGLQVVVRDAYLLFLYISASLLSHSHSRSSDCVLMKH